MLAPRPHILVTFGRLPCAMWQSPGEAELDA